MFKRVSVFASNHRADLIGAALASLFGVAFFFAVTPSGFVAGTSSYWQTQIEDITQYMSGYKAFVAAPWTLPLLHIPSLNWPNGTTVTFVDAIPAFSLVLKFLSPVVPLPDNPFGLWVLFCYAMQGAAAWFAISQIAPKDRVVGALAVVFCVMMPSLTARMGHLSLQAHFIVLIALGLYFRAMRLQRPLIGAWTALLLFSFYVNMYLTAMAIAVMVASNLDLFVRTREKKVLFLHAIPLVSIVISMPFMLGTAFGRAVPDIGFGFYSMNLLSPVAYGSLIQLPFYERGTLGQYEGYNYLGLGLIALIAFSLYIRKFRGSENPFIGNFLKIVLVALFVYALSNEVYLSDIHLLHYYVPGDLKSTIFETFRSSGRFFWPISYILVLYVAVRLVPLPLLYKAAVVGVAVFVQVVDLRPTYAIVHQGLMREAHEPANVAEWLGVLKGVKTIHAFPKFKCDGAYAREILPLQVVAAEGGFNLTTGFISRYGADCNAVAQEIAGSDPDNAAYVFTRAQFSDQQIADYAPEGVACQQLDIWIVCRKPQ